MSRPISRISAALLLLGAGVLVGLVISVRVDIGPASVDRSEAIAQTVLPVGLPVASPHAASPFVAVAGRIVPSVVAIATRKKAVEGAGGFHHPWGRGFGLEEMFPNAPRQRQQPPDHPGGSGSGFVIDPDGYILTNNHVIQGASEVTVRFADGTELDARIVGQDPETDVAVLRVDPSGMDGGLVALTMGDSEQIRVGDWAIAVGNPFGQLQGSVTVGVISAKGRTDLNIMGGTPVYQSFIQTDASINFGNSGGPLVNIEGEVIGMNTAINAAGQGIGFAIPANMARSVAQQLIDGGRVVRGYLGILPQELTEELAESMDIAGTEGILIGQVIEDTPADQGGLHTGDIITKMDGRPVSEVNDFRLRVAEQPVGSPVKFSVLRDGRKKTVKVVLDERPGSPAKSIPEEEEDASWAGITVDEISPEEARDFGMSGDAVGVFVVGVAPGSAADDAGIQTGDVILEVGNMELDRLADWAKAVEKYRDKRAVAILLKRGDHTRYVGLKP
ncbi:MAG: Do family serine endopeptidase [Gemmatimonadota bacterium]|jgi:serine protease Do|nr:Do family serine endopeptidase [Gemmatimonadota bacterium]